MRVESTVLRMRAQRERGKNGGKTRSAVSILLGFFFVLAALSFLWAQEAEPKQQVPPPREPLFVRATIYPTANLSRYDYNNDVDLYEIRAYVELRDRSPLGGVIDDAWVFVNNEPLEFKKSHYEKRIRVPADTLPGEVEISIETRDARVVKHTYPLPSWLILLSPRPAVLDTSGEVVVRWRFTRFDAPVDVNVYNFKTGEMIHQSRDLSADEASLAAGTLPPSTIVRVWVMQSWVYKRYIRGPEVARGSEVMVIPWSQVFFRTR